VASDVGVLPGPSVGRLDVRKKGRRNERRV
jgi:hypothetical protein